MVVNGRALLMAAPIKNMLRTKVKEHGVSHGLAEVGYDIRLRQEVRFFTDDDGKRWVSLDGKISTGRFTLASTMEEFDIPNNLMGIVHDKSTWARQGLSVFNTVLEPGWRGGLTMELVHHGEDELLLPKGCGIAQVVFHELALVASYDGKYQDQSTDPVESIRE